MGGALPIDRWLAPHQREEGPRGFVPVRMPERSADARLVDGAGRRLLYPGLQHAPPGFPIGWIEAWREAADQLRHRAAGRGQDGLAVPERFDHRQAVSFIARWIETECGVTVERRDCRIVHRHAAVTQVSGARGPVSERSWARSEWIPGAYSVPGDRSSQVFG